jgi:hypothetical protein
MRYLASIPCWQFVACLMGMAACATPCHVFHRGFWNYGFTAWDSDMEAVRIEMIEPNTPAAALQEKDRIVAINGSALTTDSWFEIDKAWHDAPVGSDVEFRVRRGELVFGDERIPFFERPKPKLPPEIVVRIPRLADPVAGSIYYNWQVVAGLSFIGLGVLILLTRPYRWAATGRGLLLVLGVPVLFAFILLQGWKYWWGGFYIVWQSIPWGGPYTDWQIFGWQKTLALAACAALLVCGAVDVLMAFRRRRIGATAERSAASDGGRDSGSS